MRGLRSYLRPSHSRGLSLDDIAAQVEALQFAGHQYLLSSSRVGVYPTEEVRVSGEGEAYTMSSAVLAAVSRRMDLYSQVRFAWKRYGAAPRPMASDLFTTAELAPLDHPSSFLAWWEADQAWAGNSFAVLDNGVLRRLVPWWVTIVVGSESQPDHPETAWDARPVGYVYQPPGCQPEPFAVGEVAHRMDRPDPNARFRGMSYLRPVLTNVANTEAQDRYIRAYYSNGATPNTWIKFPVEATVEMVRQFKDLFEEAHAGLGNAFKTAYLGGGADPMVIGSKLSDLAAKEVSANDYAAICNAIGVPVVVVGIIPGLENAATYANYQPALRAFADLTIRPAWLRTVEALSPLLQAPSGAELWYDTQGIAALQEDAKDDAVVMQTNAATVRTLIDAGYDPDAVLEAVRTGDFAKLAGRHSGLFSVQLQPPGSGEGGAPSEGDRAAEQALTLQRLYLSVNSEQPLISVDEAREIATTVGGVPLTGRAPAKSVVAQPQSLAPLELGGEDVAA